MEKQLTPEEIQQIKNLQDQVQQVTLQLGAVEVKKIELKEIILGYKKAEENLAKQLSDKYGVGTLDIDTGKITVLEEES